MQFKFSMLVIESEHCDTGVEQSENLKKFPKVVYLKQKRNILGRGYNQNITISTIKIPTTKRGIIDPLVSKRPEKILNKKKKKKKKSIAVVFGFLRLF